MKVFAIGCVMVIVAFVVIRRMGKSALRANDWIANRIGQTIQAGGGGGGGGGRALGMGSASAGNSMSAMQLVGTLGMLNTLGGNPLLEWVAGATPNWMHPLAGVNRRLTKQSAEILNMPGYRGKKGFQAQGYMKSLMFVDAARTAGRRFGVNTHLGAASAIQAVVDKGGGIDDMWGVLVGAGFTNEKIIRNAIRSRGIVDQNSADYILSDKRLGYAVASMQRLQSSARRFVKGDPHQSAEEVAADMSTFQAAAFRYRRALNGGVTLDHSAERLARAYVTAPSRTAMDELGALASQDPGHIQPTGHWAGIDGHTAARIQTWIGNEHANQVFEATEALMRDPANYERMRDIREALSRAQRSDSFASGTQLTPANRLHPPDPTTSVPAGWGTQMGQVARRIRWRP